MYLSLLCLRAVPRVTILGFGSFRGVIEVVVFRVKLGSNKLRGHLCLGCHFVATCVVDEDSATRY